MRSAKQLQLTYEAEDSNSWVTLGDRRRTKGRASMGVGQLSSEGHYKTKRVSRSGLPYGGSVVLSVKADTCYQALDRDLWLLAARLDGWIAIVNQQGEKLALIARHGIHTRIELRREEKT